MTASSAKVGTGFAPGEGSKPIAPFIFPPIAARLVRHLPTARRLAGTRAGAYGRVGAGAQHRERCCALLPYSRCRANAHVEVLVLEAAGMECVSRPAAGRTAAATSEAMDVTAGETAPVSEASR